MLSFKTGICKKTLSKWNVTVVVPGPDRNFHKSYILRVVHSFGGPRKPLWLVHRVHCHFFCTPCFRIFMQPSCQHRRSMSGNFPLAKIHARESLFPHFSSAARERIERITSSARCTEARRKKLGRCGMKQDVISGSFVTALSFAPHLRKARRSTGELSVSSMMFRSADDSTL